MTWEQLVLKTNFVGVVQCEVAGGMVARYRVLECWKGRLKPGDQTTIHMAMDDCHEDFPIALCGQRFFVACWKSEAPIEDVYRTKVGMPIPLLWREIPHDFHLPFGQGLVELPQKQDHDTDREAEPPPRRWDRVKKDAMALIRARPAEQELRLMQSLAAKRVLTGGEREDPTSLVEPLGYAIPPRHRHPEDRRARAKRRREILATRSVEELLTYLKHLRTTREEYVGVEHYVIVSGGGAITRRLRPDSFKPSGADKRDTLMRPDTRPSRPDPKVLVRLRQQLAADPDEMNWHQFSDALGLLTYHEPASVAGFLVKWRARRRARRDEMPDWPIERQTRGYWMASHFAWRCRSNRQGHMKTLLTAHDPYIRVVGATYLSFEDPVAGRKALRKLSELEGAPGAWAALNLARRGEKAYVPRAIEALGYPQYRILRVLVPRGFNHNLQRRLIVLLSNCAKQSGVPQPPMDHRASAARLLPNAPGMDQRACAKWWQQYGPRITCRDPWLPMLAKQRID